MPISAGEKCVRGAFVASNRIVPSLKTDKSCLARKSPFSKISAVFVSLVNPLTPLTKSGNETFSFSHASCRSALKLTVCFSKLLAGLPQAGHSFSLIARLHCGQNFSRMVSTLHREHFILNIVSRHDGHRRLAKSTETLPFSIASIKLR